MRFLDLGVAALVGISAIAGLVTWTPRSGDVTASRLALQVGLRDRIVSFLMAKGVPWLLTTPLPEVCSALASGTNGTGGEYVSVGRAWCGTQPPEGAVVANLTLRLLPGEVNLVAWSVA